MASRNDDDKYSVKIDMLHPSDDYAIWRADVRMLLRVSDIELLGLEKEPLANTTAACSAWRKAEAKVKVTIVRNLGTAV